MKKNADKGYEKTKPIKPNFRKAKMNVNLYVIKEYENETAFRLEQNKPNQTQFPSRNAQNAHRLTPMRKVTRLGGLSGNA